VAALVLWGFSGFFRVEPDELGMVLRFGQFVREVPPGLNYHLPYPIETDTSIAERQDESPP
jgi:membrane protease subunit HflK